MLEVVRDSVIGVDVFISGFNCVLGLLSLRLPQK